MAVVLLIGIPGSGKTTLTHALSFANSNTFTITFDEELPSEGWDETTFQSSRNINLERVKEHIDLIAHNSESGGHRLPGLVVVDDLMYLRSMRREVYTLGRDRNVPILVVWVRTDLEVALARNSRREGRLRLDDATIRKIAKQLQPPDPAFIFDRNSITIDGNGSIDMLEQNVAVILEAARTLWMKHQEERRRIAEQAALRASHNTPAQENLAPSVLKLLDGRLRETTAAALKLAGEYLPAQRRALGAVFATAKSTVLAQARQQIHSTSSDAEEHWMEHCVRQLLEMVRHELQTAASDRGEAAVSEHERYFDAVRSAAGIGRTDS